MIGRTLGHYRVIGRIGVGGMGEVYRAHDDKLDRDVAIKVLAPGSYSDAVGRLRLEKEARAAAALNHPGICTIHEVGESDGCAYIVMEWVEGLPVSVELSQRSMAPAELLSCAMQLADALTHAHDRGVIHRDLKPANIVMSAGGRLKVLDFGLAQRIRPVSDETMEKLSTKTHPGQIGGTPAYMSPEQLRGQPADRRSDIWALGVVLYEMASGKRPFAGATWAELSSMILTATPQTLPASVPQALTTIIDRCLEKLPERRFQTAGEVRAALEMVGTDVTALSSASTAARKPRLGTIAAIALALVAAIVAGILQWRPRPPVRIAVLPFANLTGDASQEYFSDGLTEEMIASLGQAHPDRLTVIARTSAMHYKRTSKSIEEIGRELHVDYILEGSARRDADRIHINAQLVKVADQTQLWAETYDRSFAGILGLQSEVSKKVAGSLAIALLSSNTVRPATQHKVDPEAYESYLRGLYEVYKLGRKDQEAALKHFEAALAKDPNFALAWTGVAIVWAGQQQMGFASPAEAGPKARAAALRALELDPTLSMAHSRLAVVRVWTDWDWAEGEREFTRAIALDPSNGVARAEYSHLLVILGRNEEAMKQIAHAVDLDPFNPLVRAFYGVDLVAVRKYDEAITEFRSALAAAPDMPFPHQGIANALHLKGSFAEAVAVIQEQARAKGAHDEEAAVATGYASGGYSGALRALAHLLENNGKTRAMRIANLYARTGDNARALDWLEKAYEQHDPNIPYIASGRIYDPLRSDPRFQIMLRRLRL